MEGRTGAVLCIANVRSSTGYAWRFINSLYAAVGREGAARGVRAFVSYWSVNGEPDGLEGAAAVVELDARLASWSSVLATLRFIRRERVRVLYLTDQPGWRVAYALFRVAGVRRIVVHEHTSYASWHVPAWKRALRRLRRVLPGSTADVTICVSEHVARKVRHLGHVPAGRVVRLWNSIAPVSPNDRGALRELIGVEPGRPVVVCCARANNVKGVPHLLRSFDRLETDAVLVHIGDGPHLSEWVAIRDGLRSRERIHFLSYRNDASVLVDGADIAVVPSTYEEAFGLAALEPMAKGIPVIVSDRGGLPEIVAHEDTGLVVPAGDEDALRAALDRLLSDPAERRRMGEAGVLRARRLFDRDEAVQQLVGLVYGS